MKRCLAGLCLLLMLLTACTARPSQTPVTAKDDAARRAWLEQQGWQTEEQPVRTLTVQLSLAGQEDYLALQQEAGLPLAGLRRSDRHPLHLHRHQLPRPHRRCAGEPLSLRRCYHRRGHHGLGGKRLSGIPPLSGGEHIEKREEGPLPLPPIFQYSSPSVMICDHSTGPTAPVGSKPSCRWRVSTAC